MNSSPSSESMIISWEALGTQPVNIQGVGGWCEANMGSDSNLTASRCEEKPKEGEGALLIFNGRPGGDERGPQ